MTAEKIITEASRKLWQTVGNYGKSSQQLHNRFPINARNALKDKKERDRKYKYQRANRFRKSSTAENAF